MAAQTSGGGAKAALLALMVLMAAVAVVVTDDSTPAGASELATFESCDELTGWMSDAGGMARMLGGDEAMEEAGAAVADAATAGEGDGAAPDTFSSEPQAAEGGTDDDASTGATNVIVEGVDELDRIEQLDGDRMLAVGDDTLHLVDVAAATSLASIPLMPGAQVSFDPERSLIWSAGTDGARTEVTRIALRGDGLAVEGSWSSEGMLLTGRRTAGGFHAVMTEGFGGVVPFADGPVACDEVLHPTSAAAPEATLIATLPPTGDVAPTAATEIVGAGQFVHLTDDAVFIATALWEEAPATSLHRFDLATLAHTGSGRVDGYLLNEFALSLHDGNLRVAVTHGGGRFGIPVDLEVVEDSAIAEETEASEDPATDEPVPLPEPLPVDPGIGNGDRSGGAATPPSGGALNEVVVLDTDGDLDVVGRTERFGHPDETLHGIRFVGTTAYAVTFLQTDPFYVIDLAVPTAPRVVGEVELPGFSSYLHPVGDGLVVGFGPDGDGTVAAKLFDVGDPAAPAVVDTITLGDDSPVAWDHHAFLSLDDGRFAVPATRWVPFDSPGCTAEVQEDRYDRIAELEAQLETADEATSDEIFRQLDQLWSDPCLNQGSVPVTTIVELTVSGRRLQVASRIDVSSDNPGERLLRTGDRWVVYSWAEVVVVPDGGPQVSVPLA